MVEVRLAMGPADPHCNKTDVLIACKKKRRRRQVYLRPVALPVTLTSQGRNLV